jgi:hypothetical protein
MSQSVIRRPRPSNPQGASWLQTVSVNLGRVSIRCPMSPGPSTRLVPSPDRRSVSWTTPLHGQQPTSILDEMDASLLEQRVVDQLPQSNRAIAL